jgi:cytochrome P450
MSLMLRAEHEGDTLSPEEVVSNCVLLLFAGHETTTNLLGNGLFHLPGRPEQLQALAAEPSLGESAVEELLRYDGPVPATTKVATRDLDWHGARIRSGEMVLPFLSSANRDPRHFEHPDGLDVRRKPNRHLAFAFGIHFCLGAPLARLAAAAAAGARTRRLRAALEADDLPARPEAASALGSRAGLTRRRCGRSGGAVVRSIGGRDGVVRGDACGAVRRSGGELGSLPRARGP